MKKFGFFDNLKIRHKLVFSYSIVFFLILILFSLVTYTLMFKTVEANIASELKSSSTALLQLVRTAVSASIKNHLRAVAEKNLEIVSHFYRQYEKGLLTEAQAKELAVSVLLSQTIGQTGYIACVNSLGTMVIHPEKSWEGRDITQHAFVRKMIAQKEGYLEYQWQNPGEANPRPKALYMTYFKPWDWIINVSSYRQEFGTLVRVQDFRQSVLAERLGQSGYAFVIDGQGNIIIHPYKQGLNIYDTNEAALVPLKAMMIGQSGQIEFGSAPAGGHKSRKQMVIYNHLPECDWIVAAAVYPDEYYEPLNHLGNLIALCLLVSLLLVLPTSYFISNSITIPLRELIRQLEKGAAGDFDMRMGYGSADEVGSLTNYFNLFMDRIKKYNHDLETEIAERKQAEEALRISEEKYRSVMEAAPDPIVVYDMEGRVTYMNPTFSRVFGWTQDECIGKKMDHFVPAETWEETRKGLTSLKAEKKLPAIETRRLTKSGRMIDVSIRGAVYFDRNGQSLGSVIIHRDITDLRRLEKELLDVGDREQQKIGQDLHDDLCPHLIGTEGLLKVLRNKLATLAPPLTPLADQITELIKDAIDKTRRLARGLCPVYLVDRGLETALDELAANTESVFHIPCDFKSGGPVTIRDNLAASYIFHIAQEAVHNAIKHAAAEHIGIHLTEENGRIRLTVKDNGRGMRKNIKNDGLGLRIMGFRAKLIGGVLEIESNKDQGTTICLTLRSPGKICDCRYEDQEKNTGGGGSSHLSPGA